MSIFVTLSIASPAVAAHLLDSKPLPRGLKLLWVFTIKWSSLSQSNHEEESSPHVYFHLGTPSTQRPLWYEMGLSHTQREIGPKIKRCSPFYTMISNVPFFVERALGKLLSPVALQPRPPFGEERLFYLYNRYPGLSPQPGLKAPAPTCFSSMSLSTH